MFLSRFLKVSHPKFNTKHFYNLDNERTSEREAKQAIKKQWGQRVSNAAFLRRHAWEFLLISFNADNGTISYFLHMTKHQLGFWWFLIYSRELSRGARRKRKALKRWNVSFHKRWKEEMKKNYMTEKCTSIKYLFLFFIMLSDNSKAKREKSEIKWQKYERDVM